METNMFKTARKHETAVDLVLDQIKSLLMERKLKPGDRLPNEKELSEALGVSRGSIREAMKILSAYGLVEVKVGNGTFIAESPGSAIFDSFLSNFCVADNDIETMYESRYMFEVDILQLIMKHRTENGEYIKQMQNNLERLETAIKENASSDELLKLDLEFHYLMGKASCNAVMDQIYHFIMAILSNSIEAGIRKQNGEYILDNHKCILNVILKNDVTRIEEVITRSLNTWTYLQTPSKNKIVFSLSEENN